MVLVALPEHILGDGQVEADHAVLEDYDLTPAKQTGEHEAERREQKGARALGVFLGLLSTFVERHTHVEEPAGLGPLPEFVYEVYLFGAYVRRRLVRDERYALATLLRASAAPAKESSPPENSTMRSGSNPVGPPSPCRSRYGCNPDGLFPSVNSNAY